MDATEFLERDVVLVKREQTFYWVCVPVQMAVGLAAIIAGSSIANSDSSLVDVLVKAGGVFVSALSTFPIKNAIGCSKQLNALNWLKTAHQEYCLSNEKNTEKCNQVNKEIEDRILKN
ncbi:MAG TPA: hypothetical protein VNI20_03370 [Fimbriimonadaceae bacterium]|nr:hypothetical protein [Fimbriimonadaceae bacterium]